MKTKQSHIKAKFTTEESNAKNLSGEKELVSAYKIVDKKTEDVILDCRVWSTRNGGTVYGSIWADVKKGKFPESWGYGCVSGHGKASGYGYHKESAAIEAAIHSAGIELFGTPYAGREKVDFKKRAYIGGTGEHEYALLAIAYAAGYTNCILVKV